MPQERQRWWIFEIYQQGMNQLTPSAWWFLPWERDVCVAPRQSTLHLLQWPCIQGCQSHGNVPCWSLQQWKKRFQREIFSLAPWHRSLPSGEGQPTGSPTKAPLPKWFTGVPKRRTVFPRHAGRDWRKERPKFLYSFSCCNCLQICRDRRKGPGRVRDRHALKQRWRTWPKAYLPQALCVTELNKAITEGADAAGKWKTLRREIVARCQQDVLRWQREVSVQVLAPTGRDTGWHVVGRPQKMDLLRPGESPAVAGSKWTGSTPLERSRWGAHKFTNNGLDMGSIRCWTCPRST